jgi:transcription initiation factor TFIIB
VSEARRKPVRDDVCPECGSSEIIHDEETGETVCGSCGLVVTESVIDAGPEWRAFTVGERESRTRVGAPITFSLSDMGLSTVISPADKDAHGSKLPPDARFQMRRLRMWQARSRIHSSGDRNLAQAMSELDLLADKLHLSMPVKEEAAVVYRKCFDRGLVRGRSISAIVAASLYAACRLTKAQRTLKEFSRHIQVDLKEVSRAYRIIQRELKLQMPVPSPLLSVPKIAARLRVKEETPRRAVDILRRAERLRTTAGKDPMGLAAAALYIACLMNDERYTQKMISEASGVTEVTIRNRYKNLKEDLKLVI